MTTAKDDPVTVLETLRPAIPIDPDALDRTRAVVMSQTIDTTAAVRLLQPIRRRGALAAAAAAAARIRRVVRGRER